MNSPKQCASIPRTPHPGGLPSLLVVGAGGHARAVLEAIRAEGRCSVVGLVDSFQPAGAERLGHPLLGGEADIPRLLDELGCDRVALAIGDNFQRAALWARIQQAAPHAQLTGAIHPSAMVAPDVAVGAGTLILPGALIISGARLGQGCLVNTGASLDHDGEMADWSSLAPGVVTGGRVRIGARTSVGLGARIIQGVAVGTDSVIGAGALVLSDLPDRVVAYGTPARVIRSRAPDTPYL